MQSSAMAVSGVFFILLAACAGIAALQVFLSKKEGKWAGLVLPIVSFSISLLAMLGTLLFSAVTTTMTPAANGEIVGQTVSQISNAPAAILSAAYVFLLYNIPTGVLLALYAGCRGKGKRRRELEKMSVQDLG